MFPLSDKRRREEELHAHKVGRDYMKFGNDEQRKDELHDLKISEAIMKLHHGHAKNMIQMAKLTEESPAHEKAESPAKERAEEAKGYSTGSYGVRGYHHGGIAEARVLTDLNARMAKHPPVPQGYESGTRMIPHTSGFPSVTMSSGFSKGVPNAKPEIGMQVMNWGFAGGVPMIPQNPQMAMAHSMPQGMMKGMPTNPEAGPSDTVPAMLTPGEAVIPKEAAQHPKYKKQIKQMINHGRQIQDQKAYGTGTGYAGYSEGVYNVPGYEEGVDGIPPNPFDMEVNPSIYQEGIVGGPIVQQPPVASKPLPPASPQEVLSRSMDTAVDRVTEKNQAEAIDNISVPYDRSTATRAEDFVPYSNPNISNKQASLLVPPSEMSSGDSQPAIPESVLDNKYSMVPSNAMGADNLAPYGIGLAPYGQRYTEQTNGADYSLQAPKGKGFMGLIPNQGEVSSELSASDNGKQFPLLVPTLNAEERQSVLDGKPTDAAYDKARQYAQNRSVPFARPGELRISPKASEHLQSQLDKVGQGLDNKGGNQHALSGALEWLGNAFTEKDDKGNVTSIMGFNKGDFAKMVTMAVGSRALGYNNSQAIRHAFKTVDAQAQQRHAQEFQAQKQTEMFTKQESLADKRYANQLAEHKATLDSYEARQKASLAASGDKQKEHVAQQENVQDNIMIRNLMTNNGLSLNDATKIVTNESSFKKTGKFLDPDYSPETLTNLKDVKQIKDAKINQVKEWTKEGLVTPEGSIAMINALNSKDPLVYDAEIKNPKHWNPLAMQGKSSGVDLSKPMAYFDPVQNKEVNLYLGKGGHYTFDPAKGYTPVNINDYHKFDPQHDTTQGRIKDVTAMIPSKYFEMQGKLPPAFNNSKQEAAQAIVNWAEENHKNPVKIAANMSSVWETAMKSGDKKPDFKAYLDLLYLHGANITDNSRLADTKSKVAGKTVDPVQVTSLNNYIKNSMTDNTGKISEFNNDKVMSYIANTYKPTFNPQPYLDKGNLEKALTGSKDNQPRLNQKSKEFNELYDNIKNAPNNYFAYCYLMAARTKYGLGPSLNK